MKAMITGTGLILILDIICFLWTLNIPINNQPIDKPEGHEPLGPELVAEGPIEWQSSIKRVYGI